MKTETKLKKIDAELLATEDWSELKIDYKDLLERRAKRKPIKINIEITYNDHIFSAYKTF